ncbi:MAG TPA: serine/threonine-protein kinase [Verrucomicrobiae bacterium]|nr:serine/threonine-protein kinase [Verrucomicrobiae bacterium]
MSAKGGLTIPNRYGPATKTFSGGQGKVMVCRDKWLGREVAIKIVKEVTDCQTLQNEVAALSTIESKHVVRIFDFFKDEGASVAAVVQEYLSGDELPDFASGGVKGVQDYLKVIFQIASGIADIHSHGKIHRDIKPVNMKFDSEKILKIFDFGLACDHKPPPVTTTGRGTDVYRAPELYTAAPATVTAAVDTYAFGVTAWELLDPRFPKGFLEVPPFDTVPPPSFSTHTIGLPKRLSDALNSTLNVIPAKRPEMAFMRDEIAAHLLFGKHEGRLTYGDKVYQIAEIGKGIGVKTPGFASFTIVYEGFDFRLRNISGIVDINNIRASDEMVLPGSCVITISADNRRRDRRFLTFDISHPEVIL